MPSVREIEGLAKTKYGLPIDERFAMAAAGPQLERAARALREHGFRCEIVDTIEGARARVVELLPRDRTVYTAGGETVRQSGLDQAINGSGDFRALRLQLAKMDWKTQEREMVRLKAAPDVVVGSVHAVTERGELVIASASGSQFGPYAHGATQVFFVVGAQKVVPDLETGMRRLETYSYPKEDARVREKKGVPSSLAKILLLHRDIPPGRTTVILIRETIGF